jgi:hypothetical protein
VSNSSPGLHVASCHLDYRFSAPTSIRSVDGVQRLYPRGESFSYTGRARFEVGGGVLTVYPAHEDGTGPYRVIYGPGAWATVEVDTPENAAQETAGRQPTVSAR